MDRKRSRHKCCDPDPIRSGQGGAQSEQKAHAWREGKKAIDR
jgi:hypothetical protein